MKIRGYRLPRPVGAAERDHLAPGYLQAAESELRHQPDRPVPAHDAGKQPASPAPAARTWCRWPCSPAAWWS